MGVWDDGVGLWHGAAWTFLIWGGLHGLYLVINHAWRWLRGNLKPQVGRLERHFGVVLTFGAVVFAWVFFRAGAFSDAISLCRSMVGLNGMPLQSWFPNGVSPSAEAPDALGGLLLVFVCFLVAWGLPNTIQFAGQCRVALVPAGWTGDFDAAGPWFWRPTIVWGAALALVASIAILSLNQVSEFLYFQF